MEVILLLTVVSFTGIQLHLRSIDRKHKDLEYEEIDDTKNNKELAIDWYKLLGTNLKFEDYTLQDFYLRDLRKLGIDPRPYSPQTVKYEDERCSITYSTPEDFDRSYFSQKHQQRMSLKEKMRNTRKRKSDDLYLKAQARVKERLNKRKNN